MQSLGRVQKQNFYLLHHDYNKHGPANNLVACELFRTLYGRDIDVENQWY